MTQFQSSVLVKPDRYNGESKAQYLWRVLRLFLRKAVKSVHEAEIADSITVVHGLQYMKKFDLNGVQLLQVLQHASNRNEYLLFDGAVVQVISADGSVQNSFSTLQQYSRFLYINHLDMFVGWKLDDPTLYLLNSQFDLLLTSPLPRKPLDVIYNGKTGEVVACGPGFVGIWMFRFGGRFLLPRKIVSEGLKETDVFTALALESSDEPSQQVFAVHGTAVAVFSCKGGKLLSYRRHLHTRKITAIVVHDKLKYTVTASRDGTIKVWDNEWHMQLVFTGHVSAVCCLAVHPFDPCIISVDVDRTLAVWSFTTCDQVQQVKVSCDVKQLYTAVNSDDVILLGNQQVEFWKVRHVYNLHSYVGFSVNRLTCTDHPTLPTRCVADCMDASVRIISPVTGDIITTLLMPPSQKLISSAYAISEDTLFAAFEDGKLVKADTCTNPCTVQSEWRHPAESRAQCLLIYHYMISQRDGGGATRRAMITKGLPGGSAGRYKDATRASRTLLLGGRADGVLCVYNWDTGNVDYAIQGHDGQGVTSMCVFAAEDQLLTAGHDMLIKVWRVYAFAHETLSLLTTFYCKQTPMLMTISQSRLSVTFQDDDTATYCIVLFRLRDNERYDHDTASDHSGAVTGITSCKRLKIVASCGVDRSVHIWNYANELLRVINLNAVPNSISFCSQRGDLLIGLGDHLYRIDHKRYLPEAYLNKLLAADIPGDDVIEKPIAFDENVVNLLSVEDIKRLESAHSSLRFVSTTAVSETGQSGEWNVAENKDLDKIMSRDAELEQLRDGQLTATKRHHSTPETKKQAFNNYLKMFYDLPEMKFPDDSKEEELIKTKLSGSLLNDACRAASYLLEPAETVGFFPSRKHCLVSSKHHLAIRGGYIPNSAVVRGLFDTESLESVKENQNALAASYKPPVLSDSQLAFISQFNQQLMAVTSSSLQLDDDEIRNEIKQVSFADNDSFVIGVSDAEIQGRRSQSNPKIVIGKQLEDEQQQVEEDDDDGGMWVSQKSQQAKQELALKNKIQSLLTKASKNKGSVSDDEDAEPAAGSAAASTTVRETNVVAKTDRLSSKSTLSASSGTPSANRIGTLKPLPPRPIAKSPPSSATQSPVAVASERSTEFVTDGGVRVMTPYVQMFVSQSWFDSYFTNDEKLKPWSQEEFVERLTQVMQAGECAVKNQIIDALAALFNKHGITNKGEVSSTVYRILDSSAYVSYHESDAGRRFIIAAFQLIYAMGLLERQFYVELMLAYIEGNQNLRDEVMSILIKCGLKDVNGMFARELQSWDVFCVTEDRTVQLRNRSAEWLDRWLITLQIHSKETGTTKQPSKGLSSNSLTDRNKSALGRVTKETSSSSMTQSVDTTASTYIDAINYFCEVALTKQLLNDKTTSVMSVSDANRNTVIALPRLSDHTLVRLGDSHTNKCRPVSRKNALANMLSHHRASDAWQLSAPVKRVVLNPFPSPVDVYDPLYTEQLPLTVPTTQKYFIPSLSYLHEEAERAN